MGDELDPETVRRVMARFFEEMRDVLVRHGGTVEKYIGDAVMAVFGIPKLHEDDALRALRAAADMRSALTGLNEDLQRTIGVSITTRTGVSGFRSPPTASRRSPPSATFPGERTLHSSDALGNSATSAPYSTSR